MQLQAALRALSDQRSSGVVYGPTAPEKTCVGRTTRATDWNVIRSISIGPLNEQDGSSDTLAGRLARTTNIPLLSPDSMYEGRSSQDILEKFRSSLRELAKSDLTITKIRQCFESS